GGRSLEALLWTAGACASLTSLLAHGLIDVNLHVPANGMLFAAVAGVLAATTTAGRASRASRPSRLAPGARRGVALALAAFGLIAVVALGRRAAADLLALRGDAASLGRALRLDPARADLAHRHG